MRDGWERVALGDVVALHYGKALREAERKPGRVPVVGSAGQFASHNIGNTLTGSEAVVVGRKGTAGSVAFHSEEVWVTDTAYWAEPRLELDMKMLAILLEEADLPSICAQTGVPGLNRDRAYSIPVTLPPLRQQERIVDLIAAVDEVIEKADAAYRGVGKTLSARRTAIFGALALEAPSTLEMVATRTIGRTPPRKSARYWTVEPGDRPFCTIAAMADRNVSGCSEGVTEAAEKDGVAKRVPAGSLLLSFKLSIGRLAVPKMDVFPNEAIAWIQPRDGVRQGYLQHALASVPWDEMGSRAVKGRTLNAESLNAVPVPLPAPEIQRAVEEELSILSSTHWGAERHLERLRSVRSNLLRALLSGEHVIPESYDEVMGVVP